MCATHCNYYGLPKITGIPSLPEPIMTTFAFSDFAKSNVARTPCHLINLSDSVLEIMA